MTGSSIDLSLGGEDRENTKLLFGMFGIDICVTRGDLMLFARFKRVI